MDIKLYKGTSEYSWVLVLPIHGEVHDPSTPVPVNLYDAYTS